METGTGKTYVYLRTIFELNKRYGFTKFVIVVPSVAIKEGVYKSLQMTDDHFRAVYSGTPFEYFLYDSAKLSHGGVIEAHQFAQLPFTGAGGEKSVLGFEKSQVLYDHLQAEGCIDATGKIQDTLREAIRDGRLPLPYEFSAMRTDIASVLRKLAGRLEVKTALFRRRDEREHASGRPTPRGIRQDRMRQSALPSAPDPGKSRPIRGRCQFDQLFSGIC